MIVLEAYTDKYPRYAYSPMEDNDTVTVGDEHIAQQGIDLPHAFRPKQTQGGSVQP